MERYHRHSLIDWFPQDKVMASSCAIIGCGATGNEVAKNFALLGVGTIDLFDFDTIELHNLTRSVLFRETDVGKNKAETAACRLRELDPNVVVKAYAGDFWDTLSLKKLASYSCVVCCVDNFEARIKLNLLCLLTKTSLINTGIDSRFGQVDVFPFNAAATVGCYECNLPDSVYTRMQERYSCGWLKKVAYRERKIPTTIMTASLAASLAVSKAMQLIAGNTGNLAERILVDTFSGHSTLSTIENNDACVACGDVGATITIMQASSIVHDTFRNVAEQPCFLTTSDAILVSKRCVKCQPDDDDAEVVFERVSNFNATQSMCPTCQEDSMQLDIRDTFTVDELITHFVGRKLPAKFVRFSNHQKTIIIELE